MHEAPESKQMTKHKWLTELFNALPILGNNCVALKQPIAKIATLAVPLVLVAALWAFTPERSPLIATLLGVGALLWVGTVYWFSATNKRRETELQLNCEKLLLQCAELEDTNDRVNKEANDHAVIAEELLLARDKIKESERQYQTLMEVVFVGICHITPEGKLLYANPPARTFFDIDTINWLDGKSLGAIARPEFSETLLKTQRQWRDGNVAACEVALANDGIDDDSDDDNDTFIKFLGTPIFDAKGKLSSILVTLSDITERKHNDAIKWKMAHTDPLTGLPNRQLFHDRLEDAVKNSTRSGMGGALLFLDLDKFKEINDNFGHPIGDELLKTVAKNLHKSVRDTDTVARLGGDEFAIILTNLADNAPVHRLADRIVKAISEPHIVSGCYLQAGTSIGISFFPHDSGDPDELIRKADQALYHAKDEGRSCYQIYDNALHSRITEQETMENELRLAIARQEFLMHYQPQFDTNTQKLTGVESLIRWNHPGKGLVPPGAFIGIAENSGLIIPMGEWILEETCRQNKAWQEQGLPKVPVKVNISAIQFENAGLVDSVKAALTKSGLDPQWLELEITESMTLSGGVHDMDQIIAMLWDLRNIGVSLAIDDFGTGYSSLSYIKQFPIQHLKVDQSFIRGMVDDAPTEAITKTIIDLGHSLNLKVIAEGVETQEQLDCLRAFGCDEVQGYYLARPLTPENFVKLASQNKPQSDAAQ